MVKKLVFVLLVLWSALALGHGGHVSLEPMSLLKTKGGYVLEGSLYYPETEQTSITSVATAQSSAILQKRSSKGYVTVSKIPIYRGQTLFSERSSYRIFFKTLPAQKNYRLVFLLPGNLLANQVQIKNP